VCTTNIANFINHVFNYGQSNWYLWQLAQWVSYQSYISPQAGALPVALIIVHWGLEWGWNGSAIQTYGNFANQGGTCGWPQCGSYGSGFPAFCNIVDGVKSYSALMINGYPHVQYPWYLIAGSYGAVGATNQLGINLGQGWEGVYNPTFDESYCGGPGPVNSSSPRLWDVDRYDGGSGPGSQIYNTINYSGNSDCLPNICYIQTTDPGLGF
jgi:hypothetical protein